MHSEGLANVERNNSWQSITLLCVSNSCMMHVRPENKQLIAKCSLAMTFTGPGGGNL